MLSPSALGSALHDAAATTDTAPGALLVDLLRGPLGNPERGGTRHTLLAVCPNSETVTRAALQAAQEAQAPLLFAATLNQVDRDGGYTGWTPAALTEFVDAEADRLGLTVPVLLGLDHGGPWRKDAHVQRDLDADTAWAETERSIAACIEAGYDLLHLDPTGARSPTKTLPVEALVRRTVRLMRHAEAVRHSAGRGPVAYEVGVEEADGPDGEARFEAYCSQLAAALDDADLPHPSFVVGDVGTALASPDFDADRARRLAHIAETKLGALLKGHYTDDVAHPELYPLSGMGGANVGPGLSAVEAEALQELEALAHQLGHDTGLYDALRAAVLESGRWRKWLEPNEKDKAFDALTDERQRWLVRTGSRYVWTRPEVEAARTRLYETVSAYRDAEAYVHWRVRTAILSYLHAFNLVGLADRLREAVSDDAH